MSAGAAGNLLHIGLEQAQIAGAQARTVEQLHQAAGQANSYTRLDVLMFAFKAGRLPTLDLFAALGEWWNVCDNISRWRSELRRRLKAATRAELDAMMDPPERATLKDMPAIITVYRGCYHVNRAGLSWSLDRGIAERFPSLMRFRRDNDQPLLLTGTVERERAVLKLCRDEREIVAHTVGIVASERIALRHEEREAEVRLQP